MVILITHTFKKQYKKFFKKDSDSNLVQLCSIINKESTLHGMYLQRPFMKLKFSFSDKAIRLLVMKKENKNMIIPLFITDKNDKKYGYNMTWKNIQGKIETIISKMYADIEEEQFDIF